MTADEVGAEELTRLAGSPDHQGIVAEVDPFPYTDPASVLEREDALVVALDQIQDPRNLGAICRSAEAAGANGVVICERRSAAVTPAACKTSAGAVEHLPIARVGNLSDWLLTAKQDGAWVYGADAESETAYTEADFTGKVVLVVGSEGEGLRQRVAGCCDVLVAIPVTGLVGSLNVASAASVLLFEAVRQRGNR